VRPLERLQQLASRLSQGLDGAVRWRVLGPSSSDGLRAMIEEADEGSGFSAEGLKALDMRFVSPVATVADEQLLHKLPRTPDAGDSVPAFLAARGVPLLRSIGTDDQLADALVKELTLRGLRDQPREAAAPGASICDDNRPLPPQQRPSTIAIVSEWDTLYGRTLRRQFLYDAKLHKPGFCVNRWSYVRGLDGRLPGDAAPPSTDAGARKDSAGEARDAVAREGAFVERAEGQNQFDYLRRLGVRMRLHDEALRRQFGPDGGIRAIGVMGNDVYDKLLVLQALQSEMPYAMFFTTDIDARMFHPAEQAWTRNLIVASSFGLQLDLQLQREFAPFRDGYQSAAYLGTLVALADLDQRSSAGAAGPRVDQKQLDDWLAQPRMFEISRAGAFDYSPKASEPGSGCRRSAIENCLSIHPPSSSLLPVLTDSGVFVIAALLLLATWAPALALSRSGRRQLRRFIARGGRSAARRGLRAAALAAGLLALAVLPPLLLSWNWRPIAEALTLNGKPLSLFDGISPWPTYAIRLATLVLSLYLVWRGWLALSGNIRDISRDLRLGATRRHLNEWLSGDEQPRGRLERVAAMLSLHFHRDRPGLFSRRDGMTPAAVAFWKHFLVQNRARARLLRTLLCVLAMSALALLITRALGEAPASPQRGEWTRIMQSLTVWPPGLAIQFIIFFVADAAVLCVFFIRGLRLNASNWPTRTLAAYEQSTGVPAAYLDDWIDLQFIARRTQVIGRLVYYPFVVLSLMLLARSSFFDDWNSPASVVIVAALCYAIVLGSAFALRMAAEASRKQAVERLRNAILRAKGAGPATLASQLEILRDRAERMDEGAFAPFSRQPLLRAVLLPLLTFGGSSLFDYLALVNL
jgi:hypothetical protein